MNKRVKKLWIEALLSGKYTQGRNALRKRNKEGEDRFCCLGVLCDLHAKATDGKWSMSRDGNYGSYRRSSGYLPKAVRVWAGIDSVNGKIYNKNGTIKTTLANINDALGSSFQKVRTAIEEHF